MLEAILRMAAQLRDQEQLLWQLHHDERHPGLMRVAQHACQGERHHDKPLGLLANFLVCDICGMNATSAGNLHQAVNEIQMSQSRALSKSLFSRSCRASSCSALQLACSCQVLASLKSYADLLGKDPATAEAVWRMKGQTQMAVHQGPWLKLLSLTVCQAF